MSILNTYEAVGAVMTGTMTMSELDELERVALPTIGSCPGQFTANTMAMVSEVLGLAPSGSAMMPAVVRGAPRHRRTRRRNWSWISSRAAARCRAIW